MLQVIVEFLSSRCRIHYIEELGSDTYDLPIAESTPSLLGLAKLDRVEFVRIEIYPETVIY